MALEWKIMRSRPYWELYAIKELTLYDLYQLISGSPVLGGDKLDSEKDYICQIMLNYGILAMVSIECIPDKKSWILGELKRSLLGEIISPVSVLTAS
jgi:hypothetical protein